MCSRAEQLHHFPVLANKRPFVSRDDPAGLEEQTMSHARRQIVEVMRDDQKLRAALRNFLEGRLD